MGIGTGIIVKVTRAESFIIQSLAFSRGINWQSNAQKSALYLDKPYLTIRENMNANNVATIFFKNNDIGKNLRTVSVEECIKIIKSYPPV